MDQISGATPTDASSQTPQDSPPAADTIAAPAQSEFGSRGRARRRMRFLRKARELAYRDLGGLVFNLHRFGQRNDALVLAKLTTVGQIDAEIRALEAVLGERESVTVLREAGVNACPRCAAIHGSGDHFCPNCGLSMDRHADLPIAGAPATPAPTPPAATAPVSSPAPPVGPTPAAQAPVATAVHPAASTTQPPVERAPQQHTPDASVSAPAGASDRERPTEILHPQPPES